MIAQRMRRVDAPPSVLLMTRAETVNCEPLFLPPNSMVRFRTPRASLGFDGDTHRPPRRWRAAGASSGVVREQFQLGAPSMPGPMPMAVVSTPSTVTTKM